MVVAVRGRPKANCILQLGYQDIAVLQDWEQFDADGLGRFALRLPNVRVRTQCTLILMAGAERASRRLVIFPSARLAVTAGLIKRLRFGVTDDRGKIQGALEAEGISFEDLPTRLLQDSFAGGAVLLAGFKDVSLLNDACGRFHERIKNGMSAVVMNPPPKWARWGLSRRELSVPTAGRIAFARGVGRAVLPADLRPRAVRSVLQVEKHWKPLVWAETMPQTPAGREHPFKHLLIALRRLGNGRVIVALLGHPFPLRIAYPQVVQRVGDALRRGFAIQPDGHAGTTVAQHVVACPAAGGAAVSGVVLAGGPLVVPGRSVTGWSRPASVAWACSGRRSRRWKTTHRWLDPQGKSGNPGSTPA